jgi:hypothetical protein
LLLLAIYLLWGASIALMMSRAGTVAAVSRRVCSGGKIRELADLSPRLGLAGAHATLRKVRSDIRATLASDPAHEPVLDVG